MKTPLEKLGLTDDNAGVFDGEWHGGGPTFEKISPIDGAASRQRPHRFRRGLQESSIRAHEAFVKWRVTPGPVRGETVRRLGTRCVK